MVVVVVEVRVADGVVIDVVGCCTHAMIRHTYYGEGGGGCGGWGGVGLVDGLVCSSLLYVHWAINR